MKRFTKILSFMFAIALILCCLPAEITASAAQYNWVGAWGSPAVDGGIVLGNVNSGILLQDYIPAGSTIRTVITPTISGTKIKLKFSNYYGEKAITINESTVAQTGSTDDVVKADTITPVTFNGGQASVTIAPGSEIFSDEINFSVTALKKISISSYFKKATTMYTAGLSNGTTYIASALGNRTNKETMTAVATKLSFTSGSTAYTPVPFLSRLDVYAQDAYSVVILGDSTVTNDVSLLLAEKLQHNNIKNVGIVMSGIIGNELLGDGSSLIGKSYSESLLERAKRDAFDVPGVRYVIVKSGINDVLHPMLESNKGKMPITTASQVIAGYRSLAQQVIGKGINLYLCTRTPYKGYEKAFVGSKNLIWTQQGENILLEINNWIKSNATASNYAGYIDLDALRDPNDNTKLRNHMTSDGVHFTNYGQMAFVDLIPEAAYGVNKEIKDYADIAKINPYIAPIVLESTTKKQEATTSIVETTIPAQTTVNNTTQTNNSANITPTQTPTQLAPGIVIAPAATTSADSNQVIVETPLGDDQVYSENVEDSASLSVRQIVTFAVLAIVGMATIVAAAVMLVKMQPSAIKEKDQNKV